MTGITYGSEDRNHLPVAVAKPVLVCRLCMYHTCCGKDDEMIVSCPYNIRLTGINGRMVLIRELADKNQYWPIYFDGTLMSILYDFKYFASITK